MSNLQDISAFVAVATHGGFRGAARQTGTSASQLSEAVRRLEARLGVRLLNRTTRSVATTAAGQRLLEQLTPALDAVESALDVANSFRDRPAGRLRLNVPLAASRLVLPRIVPPFLAKYPEIRLEVIVDDRFVELLQSQIGQKATQSVLEDLRTRSGATTARILRPGQLVTMEYNDTRLNLIVDDKDVMTAIRCG